MSAWNFLIVHYLGLDHIGHASGAFHSFVQEKLTEMDTVIERIVSQMNENDLLLITGDHGMADQGEHGGSSDVETRVPAVFVFHRLKAFPPPDDRREYFQIDLTPTLTPSPSPALYRGQKSSMKIKSESSSTLLLNC